MFYPDRRIMSNILKTVLWQQMYQRVRQWEGVNSIAVPGELRGMWEAHQRYGVLPWADLFAPVINMAESGFRLTKHVPYVLSLGSMQAYDDIQNMYKHEDGSLKTEGDLQYAPTLAATLRKIADNGCDEFYTGSVAQDLVQDIQDEVAKLLQNGITVNENVLVTADDLRNYAVSWEPVESTTFKNNIQMYSTPLTASGPVLQYILNVLDEYDITNDDFSTTAKKLLLYHRYLEATKFGFALRSHLGDNLSSSLVIKVLNALRSKQFAANTADEINDAYVTHANRKDYDISQDIPDEEEGLGDTSHVSVLAANGDAVSVTTSVGLYYGSRFYSNRTGLFLNDHMANFYFPGRASDPIWNLPSANGIEPGRMYMTTTCPSMLVNSDGAVKMVVGASGGSRIISANAWVILRALWMGASIEDAIEERRIYHFLSSSNVAYEERFSRSDRFSWTIRTKLEDEMGHDVRYSSQYACVQGILADDQGGIYAHSDSRKGGLAAGY
ncbi:scoloptoxin SSD14-like isoform X2 [Amphiura filiformis]|uniref:scoloptoxin SSD14-like isoform X2 n=1 Tax=Amphiura filiformis TaxID=82378 RepID=UPI003B213146